MPDYSDYKAVMDLLRKARDAEYDNREMAREQRDFVDDPRGQWEPGIVRNMSGRPRYTFDLCNPIVDQISGMISQSDFDIRIKPSGGDASKDNAKLLDGIVRSIENLSDASSIFSSAARGMVVSGISGWRIETDWVNSVSFDQDILIKPVSNFEDRVWFDPNAEMQSASDAEYCFVLTEVGIDRIKSDYPDANNPGSMMESGYYNCSSRETATIGEFFYKDRESVELVLMSNGRVYEVDEKFKKISDDLSSVGVTEVRRRKKEKVVVKKRMFSSNEWLDDDVVTPFEWLPVIPTYGNFDIIGGGLKYRGVIRNLMDSQRVYNYAKSREIEEGALAPRAKYWMTEAQIVGHERTLATMNSNSDPVQLYNADADAPGVPQQNGGAQINPGLSKVAAEAADSINKIAGLFSANLGDNPGMQSGVAIGLQQSKGDNSVVKYFKSQEVAIQQTARVILSAIPKVYDTRRTMSVIGRAGEESEVTINDVVVDQETGERVEVNNLSKGVYDAVVSAEPSFKTRQHETVKAITELAQINPEILSTGADVMLSNISAPGIDTLAERVRGSMVARGMIPDSQLNEEELELVNQQRQAQAEAQALALQQQDPAQQIAEAELEKARAQVADTISKTQERENRMAIELEKMRSDSEQQRFENEIALAKAQIEELTAQVKSLKDLKDATGADAIIAPQIIGQQVGIVSESQSELIEDNDAEAEREVDRLLGKAL